MLIFLAITAAVLLYKVIVPRWHEELFDELLDVTGVALVLSGFLIRIAARGHKEEQSSAGSALVKGGPYAIVRHPMYLGTFFIGTGIIVLLFEAWTFFIFLAVYLAIYIPQIHKEEAILLKRFAGEYAAYSRKTPLYFPTPASLRNIRTHLSFKVAWIKKELPSLLTVFAGIVAAEVFEDVHLFGHHEVPQELLEIVSILIVALTVTTVLFRRRNAS